MFNKQLRNNIDALDVQISALSKELETLKEDCKYEVKLEKLEALTKIRCQLKESLGKDKTSDAIVELDKQIEELSKMLTHLEKNDVYTAKAKKLDDLTKVRCQLAESKVKASHAPAIITLVGSLTAVGLTLYWEETRVVTSKAWGIATKMFRGV